MTRKVNKKLEEGKNYVLDSFSETNTAKNIAIDDELSSLEGIVKGALTELTDLENNLLSIIAPSQDQINKESNYLLVVRRFQNAMKIALFDGVNKRDFKTFNEGFNFYNNALEIISATGNQTEIEQVKNEFAQTLIKIITKVKNLDEPSFKPFAFKACKNLAEIYDYFKDFKVSVKFHTRAADLESDNLLISDLEYFQVFIDYILLSDIESAQEYNAKLKIKHIKDMANDIKIALDKIKPELIEQIQTKIEVLAAQRRLNVKNVIYLLDLIKDNMKESIETTTVETIQVPTKAIPLSQEKVNAIRSSLTKGIQQLQAAHPDIKIPVTAQIDTSEIISELKDVISFEISKEMKSLSNEIVSKILNRLPSGNGILSHPRSAGTISDENMPDIEVLEGGPREKPKRPKLDDMLDSVIVSE